ncbi:MAG: alpha/beta fold hydrolase, partial [Actinobacteria bacterium]|nr:alpha/beta fold hydrolase [Actinomycetota bacterium]NIS32976.1 alpha/beta fold hydrolase [Actinomycetota bacterium]NIT96570.1 alpha/beta fold hydrolase [Actinomycetota bacterium]NIU20264.1 alpha/beta fold hydrolase [Actinomycetota bacterium]NIU67915.1 alpha/beta fold hydrolase [Actinomycetota bacterium]
VFSHSYLVDSHQFDAQIEALADRYRVIAFDHRDHGRSSRATAPYDLDDLVDDTVGFIEQLGIAPCHFIGLSTGGFVGMRIAFRRPELFRSVTLMDTDAGAERALAKTKNKGLLLALRLVGLGPLMGQAMKAMFGPQFLKDADRREEAAFWRRRIRDNDPAALVRFGNAIFARSDVLEELRGVDLPCLVVAGAKDRALPKDAAPAMAAAIPGARLEFIADAGHLCTIEKPDEVTAVLSSFLDGLTDAPGS